MSEINLSSAVRSSLLSLQNTADLLATTQERLATGNRVNSALDDPTAFFTAAALNDRASDLSTLLDEQGQAIQVVRAADDGITAIQDLVETARAIATQALQTDSQTERATLAAQYDAILEQIEDLAGDASFNGTNLLDALNSQSLEVIFNEDGSSSLTVEGVNFTNASDANGLNLQRVSFLGAGGVPSSTPPIAIADLDATQVLRIDGDGDGIGTDAPFTVDLSTLVSTGPATPGTLTTSGFDLANISTGDSIQITVAGSAIPPIIIGTASGQINPALANDPQAFANALETLVNASAGAGAFTADPSIGTPGELDLSAAAGNVSFAFNDAGTAASVTVPLSSNFVPGTTDGSLTTSGFDVANITNGDTLTIVVDDGINPSTTVSLTFGTGGPPQIDATGGLTQTELISAIDAAAAAASPPLTLPGGLTTTDTAGELTITSDTGNVSFAFADLNVAPLAATSVPTQISTNFAPGIPGSLNQQDVINAINAAGAGSGVRAVANGITGFVLTSSAGDLTVRDGGLTGTITGTGFIAGTGSNFSSNQSISDTLAAIDAALGTLRTTASTFGTNLSTIQIRSDFTQDLINTLEVGAGNLTLADLNEEGANLLTLQTRQQLASTSLSFATQADQAVLSLFG